jgi:hypothetical protein
MAANRALKLLASPKPMLVVTFSHAIIAQLPLVGAQRSYLF